MHFGFITLVPDPNRNLDVKEEATFVDDSTIRVGLGAYDRFQTLIQLRGWFLTGLRGEEPSPTYGRLGVRDIVERDIRLIVL